VNSVLTSRLQVNRRAVTSTLPPNVESLRPPAAVSDAISWVQCPQEAQDLGAMCGRLPVPRDRRDPGGEERAIYFELYSHSNPGPWKVLSSQAAVAQATQSLSCGMQPFKYSVQT